MGRSHHAPLYGPSSPHGFSFRNFRKHLRMVGSRRVKAQSKMGTGKWAVLCLAGWGFVAGWGFACWQSTSLGLF